MYKEIIATGKDVEDAKETARLLLGVSETDDVNYEIMDAGSRGIFGIINVRPAKVKASIGEPDPVTTPTSGTDRPAASTEGREGREGGRSRRRRNGKKKPAREKQPIPEMPDTPAEPHEAMIPEAELKMEKVEAAAGDDLSFDFVKQLIANIGLDAEASLYSCEDNTRRIVIAGNDASAFIGHHGDTLNALQYLANLAAAKKNANGERDRRRVTIDIEGYRAKREETLRALARRMAQKALKNQRSVMLEPMSAYERRIIHSEVQGIAGVSTNSVGSDSNRKVVIYLVKKAADEAEDAVDTVPASDETDA